MANVFDKNKKFTKIGTRRVRVPTTRFQQVRFQKAIQSENLKVLQIEAQRLDNEFKNINFGGSISNFEKQFNQIKTQNPNISDLMNVTPQSVRNELNKRINEIQNNISRSKIRESKERKKGDKADRDGEIARQKGLTQGLNRLKSGEILTINSINTFAGDLRKQAKRERKAREKRKAAKKKVFDSSIKAPTGKVSRTTIKIGGKVIVGFVDDKGSFSPSGTGDNRQIFEQVQKSFGTTNVSEIERIKKIPSVAKQLKSAKTLAISQELKLTQKLVKTAQINQSFAKKKAKFLKDQDLLVKNNPSILTKTDKVISDFKKKNPNVATDPELQIDLFRLNVNQASRELNLKPLSLNAKLSIVESRANEINKEVKAVSEKIQPSTNKELAKFIKPSEQQTILNKVRTKQSMTPKELAKFNEIQLFEGKKLSKSQWNNFKTASVIIPAFIYGKNLRLRAEKGERNPFLNDIKEVKREFVKATFGLGKELGSLLGTGTRKSLSAAYNYGVRITKESQKGKFVLDDDIKKLGTSILKGVSSIADATVKVTKFIKENPVAAAIVVSTAANKAGTSLKDKFIKDPVETTVGAFLLFGVPAQIPKAVKAAYIKFSPRGTILPFEDAVKFTDYKKIGKLQGTKQDLFHISPAEIENFFAKAGIGRKDFIKVQSGTGAGIERQYYWAREKIDLAPFEKAFKKASTTKTKSAVVKSLRQRISSKFKLTAAQIDTRIKKLGEFAFYAAPNRVYTTFGNTTLIKFENTLINKFPKNIRSRINKISEMNVKQRTKLRTDMNSFINSNPNKFFVGPKTASGLGPELEVVAAVGSEFVARKTLTTQVFRFLGITKGSKVAFLPSADAFIQVAEVTFKQQKIKTNKAFMKRFISFFAETLQKIKNGAKIRPKELKKAILQFIKDKKLSKPTKTTTKPKKNLTKQQKQKIKQRRETLEKDFIRRKGIKVTKRKPKSKRAGVPKKARTPTTKRGPPKVTRKPTTKRGPPKVTRKPTTKRGPPKVTRAPTTRGPPKVTRKPTTKRGPPKVTRGPPVRGPPTTTRVPEIPPIPRLSFKTKLLRGVKLAFDFMFRERKNPSKPFNKRTNPVISKRLKLGLPENSALKRGFKKIDRKLIRSGQLVIAGTTKMNDTAFPKTLKRKFKTRKTKKALLLVEKPKFALDKKSEVKELAQKKRQKSKFKTKTPSKAKTSTKKKKMSKKTSKKKKGKR